MNETAARERTGASGREILDAHVSEREFQAQVIHLARMHGWLAFHPFDSRHGEAGYPDLTLTHPIRRRVLFIELKRESGRLSYAQMAWRDALVRSGAEYFLWKPSMWAAVVATLTGETTEQCREGEPQ